MLRSGNVATPATAAIDFVPDNPPPPGFVPIATVIVPLNPIAVLPKPSRAVTFTAGVIAAPASVVDGGTVNSSCVAAPGTMSNGALVAFVRPPLVAVSVYPTPSLSTLKFANIATPPIAGVLVLPLNVPEPGFAPSPTVTMPE